MTKLPGDMKTKSQTPVTLFTPAQREEALEWAVCSERRLRTILKDLVDLIEIKVRDHGCKLTGLELSSLTSAAANALEAYRHLQTGQ
jgi:hypothetical protein